MYAFPYLVSAIDTVRGSLLLGSPLPDGRSKILKDLNSGIPVDAGVSDGDTPLETARTLSGNLLVALLKVRLDHDTDNAILTGAELIGDGLCNLWLVTVVLERVAVRAVDHHDLLLAALCKSVASLLDILGVVVCTLGTPAKNNKAVWVSGGLGNGGETLLGDTQEVVLGCCGSNGVDGDSQTTVGTVLEAHRERETRGQLSVELGFSSSCANCTEGDEVGEELGRNGIEHLSSDGHALAGEITEELPADTETLVDLVALVDIRVIDESLPANCCPGLLEVGAHDDAEVVAEFVGQLDQAGAVFYGCFGVVEGAGSAHDEETVIFLSDDLDGIATTLEDSLESAWCGGDFRGEELRRNERVVAQNWTDVLCQYVKYCDHHHD